MQSDYLQTKMVLFLITMMVLQATVSLANHPGNVFSLYHIFMNDPLLEQIYQKNLAQRRKTLHSY